MKYILTILLLLSSTLTANTTMCYKNGWDDPSNIEQQLFKGGECKGSNSIDDMKKAGWKVDDIKISNKNDNMNFIYILKRSSLNKTATIDYKQIVKAMKKQKNQKEEVDHVARGKEIYEKNCQNCHGVSGEIESSGTSRAINTLSLEEMQDTIRGYQWDEYDRGLALMMKPYALVIMQDDLTNIYKYLQSVNKIKK